MFEYNQVITVKVSPHMIVQGCVGTIHNDKRITVTLETKGFVGFSPIFTCDFTLRKDGSWHRRGVDTGRGWSIIT